MTTERGIDAASGARRMAWASPPRGAMLADARLGDADARWLDPIWYGQQASPVQAGGRQSAWFVHQADWQGVLRLYRRGGLVARVSNDAYLWQGESRTRSFREFRLLAWMREQGLNVPAPLAAGYWRHGLSYRAAILVERIAQVRPLAHVLDEPVWDAAATAIAAMHRLGVWHADLNAYNILLDPRGSAWLIDFDRGRSGGVSAGARRANLLRLRRSLQKVGGEAGLAFWARLDQAYRACLD